MEEISYESFPTIHKFHDSRSRVRCIRGPFGSGKSSGCVWECIKLAGEQEPNEHGERITRGVVLRNTYPELISTTIKTFMDWLEPFTKIRYGSPITAHVEMPWIDNTVIKCEIFFMSGDKAKDVKKLKSLEVSWVWINEASEVPKEIIDAAQDRMGRFPSARKGGCTRKGMIMDTNPPDETHWWYDFEVNQPEGWEFFIQPQPLFRKQEEGKIYYENNPIAENIDFLPGGFQYYHDMIPGKSLQYVNIFVLNQFGNLSESPRVYAYYSQENHTDREFNPNIPIIEWTHDQNFTPMSSAIVQSEKDKSYCVDEIIINSADANDVAGEFVERYKGYKGMVYLFGDSYGRQGEKHGKDSYYRILERILKTNGFRVANYALKSNPSIKATQESLRARIFDAYGNRFLFVNPKKCPTIDLGLRKVETKQGSTFIEVEDYYQHVTTALRYWAWKRFPIVGGRAKQTRL